MTTPPPGPPPGPYPPFAGHQPPGSVPPPPSGPVYSPPAGPPLGYGPHPGMPGMPAGYPAPMRPVRPGLVTAAGVLSFVWGLISILYALVAGIIGVAASAVSAACHAGEVTCGHVDTVSTWGAGFVVLAIALMIDAGLLIAGGVSAVGGRNAKLTVVAAGILIALYLVWMIGTGGPGFFSTLGVAAPILIIVFMLTNHARAYFRAIGGRTF